mgnify:CR=1 FL=1
MTDHTPPPVPRDITARGVYEGASAGNRHERRRIVENFVLEGAFSGVMVNIVTGVLLIKFALALNASPFMIGLLAAIPFFALFMQIPSVLLLGRVPYRKVVTLVGGAVYRLGIGAMVFIPFIEDKQTALYTLVAVVLVRELGLGWGTGPWYSWVNALVNERVMGRAYGARLRIYTVVGTLAALGAGLIIDYAAEHNNGWVMTAFSLFFLMAFINGLISYFILMRLPERLLPHQPAHRMIDQLRLPFRDGNFRKLLWFMLALLFAVNIAVPFFPYYMFESLNISASFVVFLWAVTQLMQVPFFRWWGWVGDKFSHATALAASLPFFILSLLLWPFVALPETHGFTSLLLVVIHVLMGVGLAGVILATQIIAMKLAPRELVTGYTAAMSLVAAFASGMGSLVGGAVASLLMPISLHFTFYWFREGKVTETLAEGTPVVITGLEFLFLFAALLTVIAAPLLKRVEVKGRAPEEMVLRLMGTRAMSLLRNTVSGPSVRGLAYVPMGMLLRRRQKPRKSAPPRAR